MPSVDSNTTSAANQDVDVESGDASAVQANAPPKDNPAEEVFTSDVPPKSLANQLAELEERMQIIKENLRNFDLQAGRYVEHQTCLLATHQRFDRELEWHEKLVASAQFVIESQTPSLESRPPLSTGSRPSPLNASSNTPKELEHAEVIE